MNMKRLAAFIFLFSAGALTVSAQQKTAHKKAVEWDEHPLIHPLPPEYTHESAVMLVHDVTLDYRYEGKGINVYYTMHRIVKVMDDNGIEMFNKVSIPVGSRTRVPLIKARTILPDGTVKDIPKEMIKVTKNEYGQYDIVFAMEGVRKNAEVELLLNEIRSYSAFGSETFQYSVPVASTHFEISYPNDMVFEEKGYNGFPDVQDILLNNRRHLIADVSNIPGLMHEPNSFYDLHRQRAEYRIHKFINTNRVDSARLYTWYQFARQLYEEHYKITDKERAAVNKYLVTLGARPTNKEADNVRLIEDGIKNNIVLYPDMDDDNGEVLDSIIANKAASPSGYLKLFAACFTQAEMKHQFGMAVNRKEHHFDNKFENWGNMDYYLFYFPNLKKYISPTNVYLRYPQVPDEVLGTRGVFCVIPAKSDNVGATMEMNTITPLSAAENQHNIAAGISFTKDMNTEVNIAYSYTGYAATNLRKELLLEPKSKEKELVKKIITIAGKPTDILKYSITNQDMNNTYANKPLQITATVNSDELTEKAGIKYLLKIGEVLGPQGNLYNEKARVMPVDLDYPYCMNRTITVNIPKGYKIVNPEAVKMHADYVNRDLKPVISFHSDYELKTDKKNGDKLIVTISENYPQMHFSALEFDRYKAVVNTAADFNKVTLLMAKKG
jgi:hypothetical protein